MGLRSGYRGSTVIIIILLLLLLSLLLLLFIIIFKNRATSFLPAPRVHEEMIT